MSDTPHTAGWVYHLWAGSHDSYSDEFIEHLQEYHGDSEVFKCHHCDSGVHVGGKGYNEQTSAYVRFGPVFICGDCMNEAFDLPNIPRDWPGERIEKIGRHD